MASPAITYWSTTLYSDPKLRPDLNQPSTDLPKRAAERFRRVRTALNTLSSVSEQVVFLGKERKWVWMFEVGGRKIAYLHPMKSGLSATFVVTPNEIPHFEAADLPPVATQALMEGEEHESVRWCWMNLSNLAAVDALVEAARLKLYLVTWSS